MHKVYTLGAMLLAVACGTTNGVDKSTTALKKENHSADFFAKEIDSLALKKHLYRYASDEFAGRDTGSEGQKMAVDYLVAYYKELGVKAVKANGDYLQKVPVVYNAPPMGIVQLGGKSFQNGEDVLAFEPFSMEGIGLYDAGYGILSENYSDVNQNEVYGKIVLVRDGEPSDASGNYLVTGTPTPSEWGSISTGFEKKYNLLSNFGAAAVLFYAEKDFLRIRQNFDFMKGTTTRLNLDPSLEPGFVPMVFVNQDFYDHAKSFLTEKVSMKMKNERDIDTENVVALIEGSEKPEEYIIISSHLDHIGITSGGAINNGADDDGSGTVALLEMAQAFYEAKKAGHGPKRSVIFLHVTGEEKGLLGSQYYTDYDPLVPLDHTVANLNIDMIGRTDPEREGSDRYIYLIGSDKLSSELHQLSEEVNQKTTQLELDYKFNDENDPNRFYYRSDHYNFAKNNIPVIFYFNGTHEDYHKPSDTPDKIRYDLLETRTRLIFHTAWELANRETRIKVDKAQK